MYCFCSSILAYILKQRLGVIKIENLSQEKLFVYESDTVAFTLFKCWQQAKNIEKIENIKYAYTILYVGSVTETIEFYEKAFGFIRKFITPENDYGELISGETTIAFASTELGNLNFKNAINSGATEFEPLTEKPWG